MELLEEYSPIVGVQSYMQSSINIGRNCLPRRINSIVAGVSSFLVRQFGRKGFVFSWTFDSVNCECQDHHFIKYKRNQMIMENHLEVTTQTEQGDSVDSSIVNGNYRGVNGTYSCSSSGPFGFISNIFSRYCFWRNEESLFAFKKLKNRRTTATQTEERDPITARGQLLSYLLIQELVLGHNAPSATRDDVYESLTTHVNEILYKHSILFRGMINRVIVDNHYQMFESVANELFEANSNNEREQPRINWSRVITLFAFSARLAQECGSNSERINEITRFLATYVSKCVIPFVKTNGGWDGLVAEYPPPVDLEKRFRRLVMWSGIIVVTIYIATSLIR